MWRRMLASLAKLPRPRVRDWGAARGRLRSARTTPPPRRPPSRAVAAANTRLRRRIICDAKHLQMARPPFADALSADLRRGPATIAAREDPRPTPHPVPRPTLPLHQLLFALTVRAPAPPRDRAARRTPRRLWYDRR